jgi:hypothetical protein
MSGGHCKAQKRVDRVLVFFSSRPNWNPQLPHPKRKGFPPSLETGVGTHSVAREGVGGTNADEGTDIVVL